MSTNRSPSPCGYAEEDLYQKDGKCIACGWATNFHDIFWEQFPGYHTLTCAVSLGNIGIGCTCGGKVEL